MAAKDSTLVSGGYSRIGQDVDQLKTDDFKEECTKLNLSDTSVNGGQINKK